MTQEYQPSGFLNRASVVIFLVFTIPASLTLAGMYYLILQGRVPGGTDTFCETTLNSTTSVRIDTYAYTAGLVEFETQTVSVSDDGATGNELFSDTIPHPQTLNCDNVLTRLDDSNLVLSNQKSLAWSNDNGDTWQVHRVCDDPRPTGGRCDAESLNFAEMELYPDGTGRLLVIESTVDDFGEPQRDENNQPLVDASWELITENAGIDWTLHVLE